jgi:ATP-dependent Lhr-like helicase
VALVRRDDLAWLLAAARMGAHPEAPGLGAASEVLEALGEGGALFFADLCARTGRLATEVAEALWDAVARGLVTADGFAAVRTLLAGRYRETARHGRPGNRRPLRAIPRRQPGGRAVPPALAGGRWSLLDAPDPDEFEPDELAEAVAVQLLSRWGVVFRELARREPVALPWRDVLFALRRLEARGVARGGRFVAGPLGEQFATPEALLALRRAADAPADGTTITISATDPLNLTGVLLPGARVPARRGDRIVLIDGVPQADAPLVAVHAGSGAA